MGYIVSEVHKDNILAIFVKKYYANFDNTWYEKYILLYAIRKYEPTQNCQKKRSMNLNNCYLSKLFSVRAKESHIKGECDYIATINSYLSSSYREYTFPHKII